MSYRFLNRVNNPDDLKTLAKKDLPLLAQELRHFIIAIVSKKQGHLGANLGVIELCIAIHYFYNTPIDKLIWDVGHQAYAHKILTGRRHSFKTNREFNGVCGFPMREESPYDDFGTGHSSTSISAILGMALVSDLKHTHKESFLKNKHIAVIGDASIVSGMALEALNHAGALQTDITIILNDNAIGIDHSVGALKKYFHKLKKGKKSTSAFFEALGFRYFGAIDGHNLNDLLDIFKNAETYSGPKIIHVITVKGKGISKAEKNQVQYHAPGKFDPISGEIIPSKNPKPLLSYAKILGDTLIHIARNNPKIIALTPAMPTGSGLIEFIKEFPDRGFDVGITEQHAVTLAAGMATQGYIPFCVIYSTFLQRSYDQIIHDVALQKLPVVFCIDRAGIVGHDGATHHGIFDLAYLQPIPNLIITAPASLKEFSNLLYTASKGLNKPMAIRYPRGTGKATSWQPDFEEIPIGKAMQVQKGTSIVLWSLGKMTQIAIDAIKELPYELQQHIELINTRFLKPFDIKSFQRCCANFEYILTLEDGVCTGGLASLLTTEAQKQGYRGIIESIGIPDEFPTHGSVEDLYALYGMDVQGVKKSILKGLKTIGLEFI